MENPNTNRMRKYRMMTEAVKANPKISDHEFERLLNQTILDGETPVNECREISEWIRYRMRSKLGILEPYVRDEKVSEIMVNGYGEIFTERADGIRREDAVFESQEELEEIMRNIAASVHREINELNPILDARLPDGSRVNAVFGNISLDGASLTVRKFSKEHISIATMTKSGTLTRECGDFLKMLVRAGYNIFISGGTSSGKTTFLNALSDYIPREERVIVIEDSRELDLSQIENIVQMECRNSNTLGKGKVSMDMLIRTSLRMRPDRIIVGEVRGKEVADMLQAMNTGHDGSMSTGHGNSAEGMLRRLETMYLMSAELPIDTIRAQIIEGMDIFVHLGRFCDGRRKVMEVQELTGFKAGNYLLNPLFALNKDKELVSTGNELINTQKLMLRTPTESVRL